MIAEERDEGILIRPVAVVPVEMYTKPKHFSFATTTPPGKAGQLRFSGLRGLPNNETEFPAHVFCLPLPVMFFGALVPSW